MDLPWYISRADSVAVRGGRPLREQVVGSLWHVDCDFYCLGENFVVSTHS